MNTLPVRRFLGADSAPAAALVLLAVTAAWLTIRGVPIVAGLAAMSLSAAAAASLPFGLAAFAALTPFDGYVAPAVIYRDFLAADVVGLGLIAGQWTRRSRLPSRTGPAVVVGCLASLAALHLVSLRPGNWTAAADNAIRFVYFALLVHAIASARRQDVWPIAAAVLGGMTVRFAAEAWVYIRSPEFVLHPSYQFGRFTSNANSLAGFGACLWPLALAFLWRGGAGLRTLAVGVSVLLCAGILLSFSKGAWLTLACGAVVSTLYLLRARVIGWRALGLTLVALVLLLAAAPAARRVPSLITERWGSQASVISNEERLRYVETATRLILQHPVLGVGLEQFGTRYVEERRLLRGPDDPHNAYLMLAVELGLPALACHLLLWMAALYVAHRRARSLAGPAALPAIGIAAGATALMVFQLFSAEPIASRIYWLLLALCVLPQDGDAPTS